MKLPTTRFIRVWRALLWALFVGALVNVAAVKFALAESKLTVKYAISLLGVTIGSASWHIEIKGNQYSISALGHIQGVISALINGEGSGNARGILSNSQPISNIFEAHVVSDAEDDTIRMVSQSGVVKGLLAEPPFPPLPKRVPVTDDHLRGIIDPLSSALIPAPSSGDLLRRKACERRLPIFDGRRRYDVILSFKKLDNIQMEGGYRGAAIVCSAQLIPIAGHRVEASALKYLIETNDMSIWLVPMSEARVLVPIRATIPTLIGTVHVEPEIFEMVIFNPEPVAANARRVHWVRGKELNV